MGGGYADEWRKGAFLMRRSQRHLEMFRILSCLPLVGLLSLVHCGVGINEGAGPSDTGTRDSGTLDSGTPDAGASDSKGHDVNVADDHSTSPDTSSASCGTRTGMRGLTHRKMTVAGLDRTYLVYLPSSLAASQEVPFVYVFHGYLMSGQDMHDITRYSELADSEGFAVVFPDGEAGPDSLGAPWNVINPGQMVCGGGEYVIADGNDFAFMDAMKADVLLDQCLDAAHIFSAGFSMGGYFTHHVGCYRSDVRGIAPHSGGTLSDLSVCTTGHVPAIIFHGASDSVIDDGCDDPFGVPDPGFPASATLWAKKNGCQNTYTTLPTDGTKGGKGQCYLYDGCPPDGQVELCTFTGMDHCWAGGNASGAGGSNACPNWADATQLQWDFWKKYAW
jgi:polyhydroxybutyrate depolymerase